MWNYLQMLIEVVWIPCIEVEGASRGQARYFAHLVHLMVMVMVQLYQSYSPTFVQLC